MRAAALAVRLAWRRAARSIRAPGAPWAGAARPGSISRRRTTTSGPSVCRPERRSRPAVLSDAWAGHRRRRRRAGDTGASGAVLRKRPEALSLRRPASATRYLRAGPRSPTPSAEFAAVLAREPDYAPALVGAATSARAPGTRRGRPGALPRRAATASTARCSTAASPSCALQVTERRWREPAGCAGRGTTATRRSRPTRRPWRRHPEVGGLRLELADLLVERGGARGRRGAARATRPGTAGRCLRLARALRRRRRTRARPRGLPPRRCTGDPARPRKRDAARGAAPARIEMLQMPEEYRRIADRAHDHARRPGGAARR